ncbi:hypothetical protein GGR52DRAFT_517827 [Hypoxylon sp. FL1284]|nr:hypothetical protein GGR52DRAFT_517827 [Hypoxylon sp. FL1284]
MSLPAPTPSLLLTKRLTAFLTSNLGPQVHTAALTTQSGKLLAHASPHPVGTLRTQCTVAASIWAQYASSPAADAVAEALPRSSSSSTHPTPPAAVTVQLAAGVLVIRRLRCGLLFVCVGPGPDGSATGSGGGSNSNAIAAEQQQQQQQTQSSSGNNSSGNSSGNTNTSTSTAPGAIPTPQQLQPPSTPVRENRPPSPLPMGSPSEVASVASVATTATTATAGGAGVVATRRQAEELARWLDDRLGTLGALEEALGIETR